MVGSLQLGSSTDQRERSTRIEDRALALYQFKPGTGSIPANDGPAPEAGRRVTEEEQRDIAARVGARALIQSDLGPYYQGAVIYGTEGIVDLTTLELKLLSARTNGQWKLYRPDGKFFKASEDRFEWVEGGAGQAAELADWIDGRTDCHRGEGMNGFKALQMIHGVYESARLHERVYLPMQTRVNPLDLMVESGHLPVRYPGEYDIRAFLLRGENFGTDAENV